jgi:hypothetical protein
MGSEICVGLMLANPLEDEYRSDYVNLLAKAWGRQELMVVIGYHPLCAVLQQ